MMDGKSHAAAVAGELNAITAQVEDVGSLGELAEVMLEREAVYMGARALTDTRRERVVVEAIPSGGRVVVEPIPSDDGEEEEAWCDWCCQNCGEAGEDFDEPDACPECGTGDRALKFYPDSLDPPPVLAVLDADLAS